MSKPASCAEALLYELCVRYGYCLPPERQEALLAEPPQDAASFADAVIVAEGLDPLVMDKRARAELHEVVRDWLFDEGLGRGGKSGLPRFPVAT